MFFDEVSPLRIHQARVSSSVAFFEERFLSRFGLEVYQDVDKPAFFLGLYSERDFDVLERHQALAVVIWGGSDLLNRKVLARLRHKKLQSPTPIAFMATSSFIAKDLKHHGWPYCRRNISIADPEVFTPCPLGDHVSIYLGREEEWSHRRYGFPLLEQLRERLPEVPFLLHYNDPPTVPWEEMPQLYRKCFMGLRLVSHDGCSSNVMELGLMGRKCVWNGDLPNAIPWQSVDDIVSAIQRERQRIGVVDHALAESMRASIANRDWLDTQCYVEHLVPQVRKTSISF